MPPQAEGSGLPLEATCELHLTQWKGGNCQIISVMTRALGRWIRTLKAFKIQKIIHCLT
jgi:hypothetical protein